jgi:hypothetical protein
MPLHLLPGILSASDQEVLAQHNDVPEYRARLVKAHASTMHDAFAKTATAVIGHGDTFVDFGVGLGTVSRILVNHGHYAWRGGVDISKPYLGQVLGDRLYDDGWLGTAAGFCAKMIDEGRRFDWGTLVSIAYYFPPEMLADILVACSAIFRKGVILTIDAIPSELRQKWRTDPDRPLTVYDHRPTFKPDEAGFASVELVETLEVGWYSSVAQHEVPVDFWVLRSSLSTN